MDQFTYPNFDLFACLSRQAKPGVDQLRALYLVLE